VIIAMDAALPIALVEDHALVRAALATMVEGLGGYQVAVQAGNGAEYVQAITGGASVAVAIVDLHMPVMDGYATLAWIREHQPRTRALALSFDVDATTVARSLKAGACGFLPKTAPKEEFQFALRHVAQHGRYTHTGPVATDPSAARIALMEERDHALELLSPRELDFIRMVCDPVEPTYEQIAKRMGVSLNTIHGYRESIFRKLPIKSKTGLVIMAHRWGLV
jgi:two-component system invasion response regulator UvrY